MIDSYGSVDVFSISDSFLSFFFQSCVGGVCLCECFRSSRPVEDPSVVHLLLRVV